MRTTWLYTNTSMRWRWNLDQREQILLLLQVCLHVKTNIFFFLFFKKIPVTLFSIFQHKCVQTLPSLSTFMPKNYPKEAVRKTVIASASTVSTKCEGRYIISVLFFSSPCFLLDQTPTPTRFLKNCEEVGLFNELASSFEQDEDDKRAKHSVRMLNVIH